MNKLISRNPVLRFKLGRKIEKFLGGGFSRGSSGRTSNEQAAYIFKKIFSPEKWFSIKPTGGGLLGWINRTPTVDTVTKQNTVSTPKDYSFMTKGTLASESELSKKQREDYFNKLKLKYNFVSSPSKKLTNIPVNNVWLKGYKHDEVKDVRAMLNELIKLGLLKDRFGADGKWGKNTEAAYLKYLSLKNIPTYTKAELIDNTPATPAILKEPILQNDFASQKSAGYPSSLSKGEQLFNSITLRPEFKYGYSNYNVNPFSTSNFTLASIPKYSFLKQGGQLPSRNIVERFKIRKGLFGLITSLLPGKRKTIEKGKDVDGNKVIVTTIDNKGKNPFKTSEKIILEVTYNKDPQYNDTVYTYYPQQSIFSEYPIYETSNNWNGTAGVSLRRPIFEKLREAFNNLNKSKNFRKVAQ